MEEFLNESGLSSFAEALSSKGLKSVDDLQHLSDEFLLDASVGMKKIHVNKFRRSLEKYAADKILLGNGGSSNPATSNVKSDDELFVEFQVCMLCFSILFFNLAVVCFHAS
jgi:hypothetical protein